MLTQFTSTGTPVLVLQSPVGAGASGGTDKCWDETWLTVTLKGHPYLPRLRMVETLSNLLRSVVALSPSDLLPILYLSLNRLGPPQQGLELGVGDSVLLKAVAQATGEGGGQWGRPRGCFIPASPVPAAVASHRKWGPGPALVPSGWQLC